MAYKCLEEECRESAPSAGLFCWRHDPEGCDFCGEIIGHYSIISPDDKVWILCHKCFDSLCDFQGAAA